MVRWEELSGSERPISNLICVFVSPFVTLSLQQLSTYCPPVPERSPTLPSHLLFSLTLSFSVCIHSLELCGRRSFFLKDSLCMFEREEERGRVKCFGETNSKWEGEEDTSWLCKAWLWPSPTVLQTPVQFKTQTHQKKRTKKIHCRCPGSLCESNSLLYVLWLMVLNTQLVSTPCSQWLEMTCTVIALLTRSKPWV